MKIKKSDKIFLKYHNPFKYCLNESSGSRTPCFFIWTHISSASSTNEVTFYNVSYTRNDGSEGHYIAVALVENEELIPISALAARAIVDASPLPM